MRYPWKGAARPLSPEAFAKAAQALGCREAAIRAVWEVEAAGDGFWSDGTVKRRFEPHHMPGNQMTWRDSLRIPRDRREAMFIEAYERSPDAALRATSWGGPQIMGFNAHAAGYGSAEAMVRDMAESEDAHLSAFVALILEWGLSGALRAQDWRTFTARYNGTANVDDYSRKIEAAYRRLSGGAASPVVLRIGAQGAAVRRLQEALGVPADGIFGPGTEAAVRDYQAAKGLPVDGIVGARTWASLEVSRGAQPKRQETPVDRAIGKVTDAIPGVLGGGAAGTALTKAVDRAPEWAVDAGYGVFIAAVVLIGGVMLVRWMRDVA